jgi:putative ABC transport system substrate-binding protein
MWPLRVSPQQTPIAFLEAPHVPWGPYLQAFHEGLETIGYVEGKNVALEYMWAEGDYSRLPTLAADLVRRKVAIIVTPGAARPRRRGDRIGSTCCGA